jgi:hypothetical protein
MQPVPKRKIPVLSLVTTVVHIQLPRHTCVCFQLNSVYSNPSTVYNPYDSLPVLVIQNSLLNPPTVVMGDHNKPSFKMIFRINRALSSINSKARLFTPSFFAFTATFQLLFS